MTPAEFAAKWKGSTPAERAAAQEMLSASVSLARLAIA
jgi:hypothetical protein